MPPMLPMPLSVLGMPPIPPMPPMPSRLLSALFRLMDPGIP